MAIHRTVAIIAFAALVAGAFGINCYTTGSAILDTNTNTATFPQAVDTPAGSFASCLSYLVTGTGTYNGVAVSASGKSGEGSVCTCAQWASATGCVGFNLAQYGAGQQSLWTAAFRTFTSNGAATVSNPACCNSDNCNNGLVLRLSSADVPVVNVLTLLATAMLGYILASKL